MAHATASPTAVVQRRRCRRCTNQGPMSARPRVGEQEVHQVSSMTTESGRRLQRPAAVHCCQALARPHGRLGCTDRRAMVGSNWPGQRCALSLDPTDHPALTRERLRTCAAGLTFIGRSTRAQAGDPRITLGASRTSSRTTAEPMARSGSGREASGSARREWCYHRRGVEEHTRLWEAAVHA